MRRAVDETARRVLGPLVFAVAGALAALLAPATAGAGKFRVDPVRVTLPQGAGSSSVEITNDGPTPIRVQVSAHAWVQTADGRIELSETKDVVYFPRIFALAPAARRKIRIGLRTKPKSVPVEQTYRLVVEELPGPPAEGIRTRLKVTLPIFVEPAKPRPETRIEEARLERGRVRFKVRASGNVHVVVQQAELAALDDKGATVGKAPIPGGYVLAGRERVYELPLTGLCGTGARTLLIDVKTNHRPATTRLPIDPSACAP